jgi:hypothetical protein
MPTAPRNANMSGSSAHFAEEIGGPSAAFPVKGP